MPYGEEQAEQARVAAPEAMRVVASIDNNASSQFLNTSVALMTQGIDALQGVSPEARDYILARPRARELSDFVAHGNRAAFDRTIGDHLPAEQKDALWNHLDKNRAIILAEFLQREYAPNHGTSAGEAILARGAEAARTLEGYGEADAQRRFLRGCGEGLENDVQRRDMLRAALQAGFSASSVFSMETEWGFSQTSRRRGGDSSRSSIEQMIQYEAIKLMQERLEEMRRTLQKLRERETDSSRQAVQDAERNLANLVGTRRASEARRMLENQGDQTATFVEQSLREQIELSRNLHSGRLANVLPRTEGPR